MKIVAMIANERRRFSLCHHYPNKAWSIPLRGICSQSLRSCFAHLFLHEKTSRDVAVAATGRSGLRSRNFGGAVNELKIVKAADISTNQYM